MTVVVGLLASLVALRKTATVQPAAGRDARALALDPPLILADEPTGHLDYVQVESVLRIIRGLTEGGRVVVVSTHDDRMLPLADEIIEMRPTRRPPPQPPRRVSVAAGGLLFRQGDPSDLIYIVETGPMDIVRDTPDGELLLTTLGTGDHLGEMGALFGLPLSIGARPHRRHWVHAEGVRELVDAEQLPNLVRGR